MEVVSFLIGERDLVSTELAQERHYIVVLML